MVVSLSPEHVRAASRKRRTILQYDARTVATECGGLRAPKGMSLADAYRARLWGYIDSCIGQLDSIHWDACFSDQIAFCRRGSLPQESNPVFHALWEQGFDAYDEYISGCRKRGLECFLSHRVSGPDVGGVEPLKREHSEYYIWDWTRMTNFAVPEMREYKLGFLREIMELYDFDGYSLDFCRHTPFLEPGRQWELRENVTEFLRDLRKMTLGFEEKRGHPILLSARVPETAEGCRQDGLDIAAWAKERLVDSLTVGSRSFEVDLESFRRETGSSIRLFPCFDAHHQSDAYADPPAEVLDAVFSNFWDQGADGIVLVNLCACDWDTYIRTCAAPFRTHRHSLEKVLPVLGDRALLAPLDKTFVVERRGGYPWENGAANNNRTKQLPRVLKNNGAPETVFLQVSDPVAERADLSELFLDVLVYGVLPGDRLSVRFNGEELAGDTEDGVADRQIRPLQPEYVSGYHTDLLPEREERFTRVRCRVKPEAVLRGRNAGSVAILRTPDYPNLAKAELERAELHVKYRKTV